MLLNVRSTPRITVRNTLELIRNVLISPYGRCVLNEFRYAVTIYIHIYILYGYNSDDALSFFTV